MDEVAVRLDQLLREGKISKDQIFYKYLPDTVAKFFDKQHTYDADVIEFYSTIMYQCGRRTFNFLRGPVFYGQGRMNDKIIIIIKSVSILEVHQNHFA